jgi:hypothetical protein
MSLWGRVQRSAQGKNLLESLLSFLTPGESSKGGQACGQALLPAESWTFTLKALE